MFETRPPAGKRNTPPSTPAALVPSASRAALYRHYCYIISPLRLVPRARRSSLVERPATPAVHGR